MLRTMREDTKGDDDKFHEEVLLTCKEADEEVVRYIVMILTSTRSSGQELAVEELWGGALLSFRCRDNDEDDDENIDYLRLFDRVVRCVFFAMQFGLSDGPFDVLVALVDRFIGDMPGRFRSQVFLHPEFCCNARMRELLRRWPERSGVRSVCTAYALAALRNMSFAIDRLKERPDLVGFWDGERAQRRREIVKATVMLVFNAPEDVDVVIGVIASSLGLPCGALRYEGFERFEYLVVHVAVAHGKAAEAATRLMPVLSLERRRMLGTMLLFECIDGRDQDQAVRMIRAVCEAGIFSMLPCRGPWNDVGTDKDKRRRLNKRPGTRAAAAEESAKRARLWNAELDPEASQADLGLERLRTSASPLVRLIMLRWKPALVALVEASADAAKAYDCVVQAAKSFGGDKDEAWVVSVLGHPNGPETGASSTAGSRTD